MISFRGMLHLARVGAVIATVCGGVAGASAEELVLDWKRQPGTEYDDTAAGIATDSVGNLYVTGQTAGSFAGTNKGDYDAWLAKYDSSGRQLWKRQPGTQSEDAASAVATWGTDAVYVAGSTAGSLGGESKGLYDAWLAKYDGSGRQLWKRQPGSGFLQFAVALATDGDGNVYVAGTRTGTDGDENAWLAKFDSDGRFLWQRRPSTPRDDDARGVATDGDGNVYLVGSTTGDLAGPNHGGVDAWVAKYDHAGALVWNRQLGTRSNDYAWAVATSVDGGLYVTGTTDGRLGGPQQGSRHGRDVWLAKYDSAGGLVWKRQPGTDDYDEVRGVTTDSSGKVYITGWTGGSFGVGNPAQGGADIWLAMYDASGRQLWKRQPGTDMDERAFGIATDGAGSVYVSGWTQGSLGGPSRGEGAEDGFLLKFSPTE